MSNLEAVNIPAAPPPAAPVVPHFKMRTVWDLIDAAGTHAIPAGECDVVDITTLKFILDNIIDFIEALKLQGEPLVKAGQLLRDVENYRDSL